jgi:nucleoid-associated protein YgaU
MSNPPKKPDFSNVHSTVTSTEKPKADFSNVQSTVTSSEQVIDGGGEPVRTYTVVRGDTLSHIARHFYGKAGKWPEIYAANRDQLDNPDRIKPGQVLKIPSLDDGTA